MAMAYASRRVLLLFLYVLVSISSTTFGFVERSWDEAIDLANQTVSLMTMSEKIGMVRGVGQFSSRCIGNITPPSRSFSVSGLNVTIPPLCLNDGPAGVRLGGTGVTGFPPAINAASTFSRSLMNARGVAIGEEFRGKGIHVHLGPAVDLMRNPKAGRGWEGFGPDPYLSGEGTYQTITGIQSTGVSACVKHYSTYNQEHWRYGLNANSDDRTFREMYWWPFMKSVEANVSSAMCAYNQLNGTSSCHNAGLIGDEGPLRQEGFKGFMVSDWGATHDSAEDNANAGLDMEQPGDFILIGGGVFSGLQSAVNSGEVSQARLDEMVVRILTPWFRLGQDSGFPDINFDAQNPDGSGDLNENVNVRTDAHTALVRQIGSASAVLLKNNRTSGGGGLPLTKDLKTIAVVGYDAQQLDLNCAGGLNECNTGTMVIGWGSGSNNVAFTVPPIQAIQDFASSFATISTDITSNDLSGGPAVAKGKDLALVFANAMSGELGFYQIVDGNEGDRNDLNLWFKGGSLIEDVAAVCNNTVVVVHSVGPVPMSSWNNHPNITAIIYAGAPGEQTGPSLVDVLWGAVNPSGRLPFSIDDDEASYGTEIVYGLDPFPVIDYTEGVFLDYRYMESKGITPVYEFGFGLSYTEFTYSSLQSSVSSTSATFSFTLTNSGSTDGTEIPQLYLGFPTSAGEPSKVLRGFDDIFLAAGASQTVSMTISQKEMSIWDVVQQEWVVPSGTFDVYIGASIKDIRLTSSFTR
ncbi:glycoside hydrolase family 3 protein [Collybiopsis luxurians FD-317 M1]|uniref:beta-glucosidase n=1 Tax=Collybiopsis luxurians FD-317 M1 TaxID=944289 RepID=A0A0D0CWE7_9AGAR|nr:glycoside hydrolase family 3 protein [Collybiopsis luxurians FD-317 M1]